MNTRLAAETIDVTLPGRGCARRGGIHPVIRTWERVEEIFRSIGFDVADGPEIETDWMQLHRAEQPGLNHPARSMQDTLLRATCRDSDGKLLLCCARIPARCRCATPRMHGRSTPASRCRRSR